MDQNSSVKRTEYSRSGTKKGAQTSGNCFLIQIESCYFYHLSDPPIEWNRFLGLFTE